MKKRPLPDQDNLFTKIGGREKFKDTRTVARDIKAVLKASTEKANARLATMANEPEYVPLLEATRKSTAVDPSRAARVPPTTGRALNAAVIDKDAANSPLDVVLKTKPIVSDLKPALAPPPAPAPISPAPEPVTPISATVSPMEQNRVLRANIQSVSRRIDEKIAASLEEKRKSAWSAYEASKLNKLGVVKERDTSLTTNWPNGRSEFSAKFKMLPPRPARGYPEEPERASAAPSVARLPAQAAASTSTSTSTRPTGYWVSPTPNLNIADFPLPGPTPPASNQLASPPMPFAAVAAKPPAPKKSTPATSGWGKPAPAKSAPLKTKSPGATGWSKRVVKPRPNAASTAPPAVATSSARPSTPKSPPLPPPKPQLAPLVVRSETPISPAPLSAAPEARSRAAPVSSLDTQLFDEDFSFHTFRPLTEIVAEVDVEVKEREIKEIHQTSDESSRREEVDAAPRAEHSRVNSMSSVGKRVRPAWMQEMLDARRGLKRQPTSSATEAPAPSMSTPVVASRVEAHHQRAPSDSMPPPPYSSPSVPTRFTVVPLRAPETYASRVASGGRR